MKITLSQDEIVLAVDNYVRTQVNINDDQEIEVEFKNSRGENGMEAILDIRAKVVKPVTAKSKATTTRAKPAAEEQAPQAITATPEDRQPAAEAVEDTDPAPVLTGPVEPVEPVVQPAATNGAVPLFKAAAPVAEAQEAVEAPAEPAKPKSGFSFAAAKFGG